ncbi:MAG: hypothetical protein DMG93_22180, partial [Acidobacteria bacterium]
NREEFATGVGLFTRVLPVRANFDDAAIFSNLRQQTAAAISPAVDHQDYFSVDRIAGHVPVGFASVRVAQRMKSGDLAISEIARLMPSSSFKLQLRSESLSGSTRAFLEYDTAYFAPETIAQLAERFAVFASAAHANPGSLASALPLMSDRERKTVLVEFNQTAAEYPADRKLTASPVCCSKTASAETFRSHCALSGPLK